MKFLKKNKNNKKDTMHKVELGNLYDINKSLIENNVVALTEEEMNEKKQMIITFLEDTDNHYYMLLCNDRKDYTVFHHLDTNIECLQDVLIDECLPNRGKTKSFELTENKDAIEIWLSIDGESYCYYFFPYDSAIIEC